MPLFIPIAGSCINTFIAQLDGQSINSLSDVSISDRILNAFISIVQYIYKTIWPDNLSFLYPYPEQINVWFAILCLLIFLSILIAAMHQFSKKTFLLTGYMWFIVALMPVVGIIQIGAQSMADRYMYIPHIGLFWAVIWTFSSLFKKQIYNQMLTAFFCIVLMGLSYTTFHQAQVWNNGKSLFQHAITNTRNNYIAHNNLGACLANPIESLAQFNRSIEINPKYITSHINRGKCLLSMGKINEAKNVYQSILKDKPYHIQANIALAELYHEQHQLKKALQCYYNVLKEADNISAVYYNIGKIFKESGHLVESEFFYSNALKLNPLSPVLHFEYGQLQKLIQDN